jgi:cellulose synthase/poly-beta-1,6-N-acetylglucosamine synthase-like glycosyltransferase
MHGRFPLGLGHNPGADAARITATPGQIVVLGTLFVGIAASLLLWPSTVPIIFRALQIGFLIHIGCRLVALVVSQRPPSLPLEEPALLPRYSIVVALYDEAAILPQLLQRLRNIDYPTELLDGYLVLEAHDHATIDTADSLSRPHWLNILVVPPGVPTTKPRALNQALAVARGELLTV